MRQLQKCSKPVFLFLSKPLPILPGVSVGANGTDLYNCEVTPTGRGTAHIFEFEGFEECDQRDLAGVS